MNFAQTISKQLDEEFAKLGFRKLHHVLTKFVHADGSAFLGLGRRTFPDGLVSIFPVIGVRHESLYKLGTELGAYPDSKSNPTLSVALEYLVPKEVRRDYDFPVNGDRGHEVEHLVADIQRYGFPFYEAFGSIDGSLEKIRLDSVPELNGKNEFIPLSQLMQGNSTGALLYARQLLTAMDASRGTGKQYAQFVERLARRCARA